MGAVASLRKRVAEIEEINEDLVAFARGHAGAVSAIHEAVLAALAADTPETLMQVVTGEWPLLLRVDAVAMAWANASGGFRADRRGLKDVEPRLIERMASTLSPVTLRLVDRGHPLFGAGGEVVRNEALIRLDGPTVTGLIVLGQREGAPAEGRHGARLLRFLGSAMSHILERCPPR
ncbi:DUF484 domain-containing protein [Sphingomonas nostoxanthinifaciens]|uniref:DUF484 domain-containing protein n=1 Tax=Sphingomonas nostoxanthinifaciens TaxID=2872652 RepID=UPI001CC1F336|nr:DUF484 domain-containing protein [Sphingomonas nostoxanthinifaciens]